MKYILMALGVLFCSNVWADDGSYEIDVSVCDICNFASALELAKAKAPPVVCSGGTTHTDQPVCSAEVKELIVANPLEQTAYKFRVQRSHPHHFGQSQQLELNWGEQQMINRFFDIDREIREAVWAASAKWIAGSSVRAPARAFHYDTDDIATDKKGIHVCQSSAAAHVFSSAENQMRLLDVIRADFAKGMNQANQRYYLSSEAMNELGLGSRLIVKAGLSPDKASADAAVQGNFYFDMVRQSPLLRALGGSSCHYFSLGCTEDYDNYIHYHVTYGGRADTRGIDQLNLQFELDAGTSVVDGQRVSVILAQGASHVADVRNLPPESCLAQLLKEQLDNYEQGLPNDIVAAESIGPGIARDFKDGLGYRKPCEQKVTLSLCTVKQGFRSCQPTTFRSYRACN